MAFPLPVCDITRHAVATHRYPRPDFMNAQYFTEITLGTPPQSVCHHVILFNAYAYTLSQFKVILDTGYCRFLCFGMNLAYA